MSLLNFMCVKFVWILYVYKASIVKECLVIGELWGVMWSDYYYERYLICVIIEVLLRLGRE